MFALNRKLFKAYVLKGSLDRLWTYHYEGAMLNYLQRWIDQLRWRRLKPFQKLAEMLLDHLAHSELLPHQGSSGVVGGREWEHQDTSTSRAGIQEPALPPGEGTAHGVDPRPNSWYSRKRPKMKVPSNSRGEP